MKTDFAELQGIMVNRKDGIERDEQVTELNRLVPGLILEDSLKWYANSR